MKLFNLINVANKSTTMMLTGVLSDGAKVGYDFSKKAWMENSIMIPDRLITINDFSNSKYYHSIKKYNIVDFSSFKVSSIKAFKGIKTNEGIVLNIIVKIGYDKKTILRETLKQKAKKERISKYRTENKPETCKKIDKVTTELEEDFYQSQVLGIPLK